MNRKLVENGLVRGRGGRASARLRCAVAVVALAVWCGACGDGDDDEAPLPIVVLGAFPYENVPLLEQATINETIEIEGHPFRIGTLGGVPVMIGLTGIGLANASLTSRAVLEQFKVAGVIFSGVAGSPLRIGDVTVPEEWVFVDDPTAFPVTPDWLALAETVAASGTVSLDDCTERPDAPEEDPVCLPHQPAIVPGGVGKSEGFAEVPLPCVPGTNEVIGCDVAIAGSSSSLRNVTYIAEDMETTAVAREAAAHGVPFIGFRGVSDGAGDPLGLPGFPAQFFAYYRLASRNAAAATIAFLEQLAAH